MKRKSLKAMKKFLRAQRKAEKANQRHFECPICGGDAEWSRISENWHIHIWCNRCGPSVNE